MPKKNKKQVVSLSVPTKDPSKYDALVESLAKKHKVEVTGSGYGLGSRDYTIEPFKSTDKAAAFVKDVQGELPMRTWCNYAEIYP